MCIIKGNLIHAFISINIICMLLYVIRKYPVYYLTLFTFRLWPDISNRSKLWKRKCWLFLYIWLKATVVDWTVNTLMEGRQYRLLRLWYYCGPSWLTHQWPLSARIMVICWKIFTVCFGRYLWTYIYIIYRFRSPITT